MNRMARFFSKHYYLPLKWRLERFAEAHSVTYPHPSVLQAKRDELQRALLTAKQEGRSNDVATLTGELKMLKYVLEYEYLQGQENLPEQRADSHQT